MTRIYQIYSLKNFIELIFFFLRKLLIINKIVLGTPNKFQLVLETLHVEPVIFILCFQ